MNEFTPVLNAACSFRDYLGPAGFLFNQLLGELALPQTKGRPAMIAFVLCTRFVCPGEVLAFVNAFVRERYSPEPLADSVSHLRFAGVCVS